jgi:hypothetical protein
MPRHQQVTTCRHGGPVSEHCYCEHCALSVCAACGAYEGSLTTDCPGEKVSFDRQQEVCETRLDYTDARGWHQGDPMTRRSPRFEPPPPDPRAVVLPSTDWERVDRVIDLQRALARRAIAWVLADRIADDHAADLTRIDDEVAAHMRPGQPDARAQALLAKLERAKAELARARDEVAAHARQQQQQTPDARAQALLAKLEYAKISFQLADQRAQKCDDELRQAARQVVAALEDGPCLSDSRTKGHD